MDVIIRPEFGLLAETISLVCAWISGAEPELLTADAPCCVPVEEVRKMPGVLNVTVMSRVGQIVEDTNALERVCLRIHALGETKDALARLLVKISATLKIVSSTGEEMQLEHLTYERCINAINHSVSMF